MTVRFKRMTVRVFAVLVVSVIGIVGSIAPVQAQSNTVDSITIKWREDVLPQGAGGVSDALQTALGNTLRIETSVVGRNRDGSFILQLSSPQSVDAVRAAINRVRMSLPVIYANLNAAAGQRERRYRARFRWRGLAASRNDAHGQVSRCHVDPDVGVERKACPATTGSTQCACGPTARL